jgi:tetratricopeptide (TPR) repeat protein
MLAVTSGNWVGHNGYAIEVQKLGRLQEAIAHYRAAVAINFSAAYLRGSLAFALYDAGESDEAIEQLQIYLRMSPGNSEAYYRLGLLLGRAGRFSESLPALREATRLRPWFPAGWDALGVTCASLGLRTEAEAAFREVLRIEPGNQNVRQNLERLQAQR